jgi:translation initiation factor IF-1
MVKNTTGGNKSKGQARKLFSGGNASNNKLRLAKEDGEIYCQVVKIYGSMNCSVVDDHNITRRCIIRGKFRGRGKRDNMIRPGTWVLVGARDWESRAEGAEPTCDLLEVYGDGDKERLKSQVLNVNWKVFIANDCSVHHSGTGDQDVVFSDTIDEEYANIMEGDDASRPTRNQVFAEDEEIDVDDI